MKSVLEIKQGQLQMPVSDRDHMIGTPTAPVTLVEYGDYECPYCGAAYPVVSELLRVRGPVIRFAYRHFPLTNVHPHAEFAAEAAEAAGTQGKYWEMHDWLFTHQDQLEPPVVAAAAEQLGVDSAAFTRAVTGRVYYPKVQDDFMSGLRSGVNGTPTFFINGHRHDGAATLPALVSAVDAEMA